MLNGTSVIGSVAGTRADLSGVFALHTAGQTRVVRDDWHLAEVDEATGEVAGGRAAGPPGAPP